ncbi:hypothetical protein LQ948_16295 [Jiella sp. MQZ9-1]|uniref:Uncharacterized protein n=1 Tax=Jiella flava TaxID=2816857 RepID=A0A939JX77_9HYPH|nr:hypothetical protein [Jiella flava]MBO0664309.1 hypothetical protein [Jiella flava]MCD2472768.1 hypothetical protein [Jiella flava]
MIATALTFAFGFLAAMLIALVIAPLFWSRSRRLALKEYRAAIPASARELRASLDHVRAAAALSARRREVAAEAQMEKAALARAEAGRLAGENADLQVRNVRLADALARAEAQLADASERLARHDSEIDEIEREMRGLGHDLDLRSEELGALAQRFRELGEIAEERKQMIVEREARIETLSDALRQVERDRHAIAQVLERLRGEVGAFEASLSKEKTSVKRLEEKALQLTSQLFERDDEIARLLARGGESGVQDERTLQIRPAMRTVFGRESRSGTGPDGGEAGESDETVPGHPATAQNRSAAAPSLAAALGLSEKPDFAEDLSDEELRQTVGNLAAQVIALTAERDGPGSPLSAILSAETTADGPPKADQATPSLADRVRMLREEFASRDHAAE